MLRFLIKIFLFAFLFVNISPINGVFSLEKNFGGINITTNGDQNVANRRVSYIYDFFNSSLFSWEIKGLKIIIDSTQKEPRAQIKGREIRISATVLDDSEFFQLFLHEFGHFVDLYILKSGPNKIDPSNDFYKISWKSTTVKHSSSSLTDFISGYGASNKYEDFAESFVWYIAHNEDFYEKAMKNDILRQKYLFFADNIFTKGEFQATSFTINKEPGYLWDTTKISINLQKYLNFLKTLLY